MIDMPKECLNCVSQAQMRDASFRLQENANPIRQPTTAGIASTLCAVSIGTVLDEDINEPVNCI